MTTIRVTVRVYDGEDYDSLASTAVNTNDSFVAVDGERIYLGEGSKWVFMLPCLDAGSEENELCSSISGPACPPWLNVRTLNGEG
mmetsp:Transcript_36048/g.102053  ORF Transcript_36048/g.102053 Transcript_36048/m.102053 type:complete len:85 (-) Transcript_36048:261-515(-)